MKTNKYGIINKMAERGHMTKALALKMVTLMLDIIGEDLGAGGSVVLTDIGTLKPTLHKAFRSGCLKGGEPITVPAKIRVRLISHKPLKDKMDALYKLQQLEHTSLFK